MSSARLSDAELERLAGLSFLLPAVPETSPARAELLGASAELIAEVQRQRKEIVRLRKERDHARSERDRMSPVVTAAADWQDDPSVEADTALHSALYTHADACEAAAKERKTEPSP